MIRGQRKLELPIKKICWKCKQDLFIDYWDGNAKTLECLTCGQNGMVVDAYEKRTTRKMRGFGPQEEVQYFRVERTQYTGFDRYFRDFSLNRRGFDEF